MQISDLLAACSLATWLCAQSPQLWVNYKHGSVEGLALPFLVSWAAGDLANLIGCILTDQLAFQKGLATYFCTLDLFLFAQYLYYTRFNPPLKKAKRPSKRIQSLDRLYARRNQSQSTVRDINTANMVSSTASLLRDRLDHLPARASSQIRAKSMILLSVFSFIGISTTSNDVYLQTSAVLTQHTIGRIFAWVCATLYLTSRLPQVYKNFTRQSCEGLSMLLFGAAFCGNSFYVASIMTSPSMKQDPTFLLEAVPFLLGSGGTLVFDISTVPSFLLQDLILSAIMFQAWLYRPSAKLHKHRHRHRKPHTPDEEAGLLADDSISPDRGRHARSTSTDIHLQRSDSEASFAVATESAEPDHKHVEEQTYTSLANKHRSRMRSAELTTDSLLRNTIAEEVVASPIEAAGSE